MSDLNTTARRLLCELMDQCMNLTGGDYGAAFILASNTVNEKVDRLIYTLRMAIQESDEDINEWNNRLITYLAMVRESIYLYSFYKRNEKND